MLSLLTAAIIGYPHRLPYQFFQWSCHYNIAAHKNWNDRFCQPFPGIFIVTRHKIIALYTGSNHIAFGTPWGFWDQLFWKPWPTFLLLSLLASVPSLFFSTAIKFVAASSKEDPVILEREKQRQVLVSLFFICCHIGDTFYFSSVLQWSFGCWPQKVFYPFFKQVAPTYGTQKRQSS